MYKTFPAENRVYLTLTSERVPPALGPLTVALNRADASKRADTPHIGHSSLNNGSNPGAEGFRRLVEGHSNQADELDDRITCRASTAPEGGQRCVNSTAAVGAPPGDI